MNKIEDLNNESQTLLCDTYKRLKRYEGLVKETNDKIFQLNLLLTSGYQFGTNLTLNKTNIDLVNTFWIQHNLERILDMYLDKLEKLKRNKYHKLNHYNQLLKNTKKKWHTLKELNNTTCGAHGNIPFLNILTTENNKSVLENILKN